MQAPGTSTEARGSRLRLAGAAIISVALVAGAVTTVADGPLRGGSLGGLYRSADQARQATAAAARTKNDVSRAGVSTKDTQDPTTATERRANAAAVAAGRRTADPELTTVPVMQARRPHPQDRYAMANGCYTLQTDSGAYLTRSDDGLAMRPVGRASAARFYFKPTDLGSYLLYGTAEDLVSGARGVSLVDTPGATTVWSVSMRATKRRHRTERRFTFRLDANRALAVRDGSLVTAPSPTRFRILRLAGCATYPEAHTDVAGDPHAGVTPYQEVRGYVDAHTHGMAFEFLGGDAHCGKPWDPFGVAFALVDCPDHTLTGGYGAALEAVLSGVPHHDPVGWPTFKDWPAPESLTHEGTYYKWLERSWRGGQRILVNLLVENNKLCQVYPLKRNSCDEMDSIRLQAKDMYALQDYIDAQSGGPGKGFYRIVKNPFQARKVINSGKLAVIMGIEASVPFGCTMKLDFPQCNAADIDRQIDEVHRLGVRQMELVNKFDNALAGVAGDNGTVGTAVNVANFLETGSFWDMRHCEPADGESHDRNQVTAPDLTAGQQDALFGAVASLGLNLPALPLYPRPDHCNSRGLTTLGAHTIDKLVERRMIFDPDHMSVKARATSLDQLERLQYPGVVSSHSWATPDAYPRIYELGGFITPYAGDSTGFVEKWRRHLGWADRRFYFGMGYGADINGLGAQGDPRGADVANKVGYPFTTPYGATVRRQTAGQRTWDINTDGVAQYGLYPDWIEDLSKVAGADGAAISEDMTRGAEAYLQMWERSQGIAADSCRNPDLRRSVHRAGRLIRRGMSTRAVMEAVGQPYTRLGSTYGFCAKTRTKARVMLTVEFGRSGRVKRLHRT